MPKQVKRKTKYPGVYYTLKDGEKGRAERVYFISYRKDGKLGEEAAGGQFKDNMTQDGVAHLRNERLHGDPSINQEGREGLRQAQKAWTFDRLWETYKTYRPGLKGLQADENRYQNHLRNRRPATVYNILELLRRLVNFADKKRLCEIPSLTQIF